MSGPTLTAVRRLALAGVLTASLGGCSYDYLQRTDRVAYSAGDAVQANLQRETTNPSHASQYQTKGLGKNGNVANNTVVVAQ